MVTLRVNISDPYGFIRRLAWFHNGTEVAANCTSGISESAESIAKLLTKMCLRSEVAEGGRSIKIEIPPTRAGK